MSPLPEQEENNIITEATGLLKKTYGSNGSLPLASSYDDVRDSLEMHLQRTLSDIDGGVTKQKCGRTTMFRGKKNDLWILLMGCVLTLCLLMVTIFHYSPWQNAGTASHSDGDSIAPAAGGYGFPLSDLDPVNDLGLPEHTRAPDVSPDWLYMDKGFKSEDDDRNAIPTNAWYQNLIMARGEPSNIHRAYPVPYLIDVVGAIPGLRAHVTHVEANAEVMQLSFNEDNGLVVGATKDLTSTSKSGNNFDEATESYKYKVMKATELGITLEWNIMNMSSNIVRGMPFITMEYAKNAPNSDSNTTIILPTIASSLEVQDSILVDGTRTKLGCSGRSTRDTFLVEREMELYFPASDFSWLIFFSEPARVICLVDDLKRTFLQVVEYESDDSELSEDSDCANNPKFVVRAALIDQCTTNSNSVACRQGPGNRLIDEPEKIEYTELLRAHSALYPGRDTRVSYTFLDPDASEAELHFHWDPQSMTQLCEDTSSFPHRHLKGFKSPEMLMFALTHHVDKFLPNYLPNGKRYCKQSLIGPSCLVKGNKWTLVEELPTVRFRAARPPKPEFIPALATVLTHDIEFRLPKYFKRGAGDTYFSGKYLSKLSRILAIAEEVGELCGEKGYLNQHMDGYIQFCQNITLPSPKQIKDAIQELQEGVEVWINGKAETPFVYDKTWGGVISCGCYMENEKCVNQYPDCPGFADQGLNFGNGFYNDHHFHYGYHIYAAATVAHFNPDWGKKYFERVLLLVRDIANPSHLDPSFVRFRHKDWYQGSSWASGTTFPAYLNQKNQESSSEAIMAYESVAIFGQTMHKIWKSEKNAKKAAIADEISKVGRLLTSTELTAAKKYWHVPPKDDPSRIYPETYDANVIGIMWNTMAQFGTWFGAAGYLPYGIQLLPLTPISEENIDQKWAETIYKPFTKSCASDFRCTTSGWAVLQLAVLAGVGYREEAAMRVKELPDDSFENAGGNGHSRTNTIWYIATRPDVNDRIPMLRYDLRGNEEVEPVPEYELSDCYVPKTCTAEVLTRMAGEYTCAERIIYLIQENKETQWDSCFRVGGLEFPEICGPCNPGTHYSGSEEEKKDKQKEDAKAKRESHSISSSSLQCPACSQEECDSDLNRCPVYKRTFVCTAGTSRAGCSGDPQFWVSEEQCDSCCEMTDCQKLKDKEAQKFTRDGNALQKGSCPPCPPSICYGKMNQCPLHTAPYICTNGTSIGGCASSPWNLADGQCSECCEIKLEC